jgi:uncharacterized protein
MKKVIFCILTVLTVATINAQDIAGAWNGLLEVQGSQLPLVFNITKTATGISATMDSPDQGAKDIPTSSARFENGVLTVAIANMKLQYEGKLGENNTITGTFKQGPMSLPLNLTKAKIEKAKLVRPQEPTQPYPYYAEDVTFTNAKAQITLAGTLTLPKKEGKFPVVVLISGSGPQNRDEELLGHKPFLVLADHLTKNGIGVLRFDDRGVGASKGNFSTATSADFATDVEAAVNYLLTRKDVITNKIGLMGHSEGGVIAPMVAAKSKDVAFIVLLAGTGIKGDELLLLQGELIGKADGETAENLKANQKISKGAFDMVTKLADAQTLKGELELYFQQKLKEYPSVKPAEMPEEQFIQSQVMTLTSPWMRFFIKYDPATALASVKCPVLAINGEKDLQVPAKINLDAIKMTLEKGKNKYVTTKALPNLNHLFQECTTGSPSEYAKIEQTFAPVALDEITNWLLKQVK